MSVTADQKAWLNVLVTSSTTLDNTNLAKQIVADCTAGNIVSTLFVVNRDKSGSIRFFKLDNTANTHTLVAGTGQTIEGYPDGVVLSQKGEYYEISYGGDGNAWRVTNKKLTLPLGKIFIGDATNYPIPTNALYGVSYLTTNGDDNTAMFGNMLLPYGTLQTAFESMQGSVLALLKVFPNINIWGNVNLNGLSGASIDFAPNTSTGDMIFTSETADFAYNTFIGGAFNSLRFICYNNQAGGNLFQGYYGNTLVGGTAGTVHYDNHVSTTIGGWLQGDYYDNYRFQNDINFFPDYYNKQTNPITFVFNDCIFDGGIAIALNGTNVTLIFYNPLGFDGLPVTPNIIYDNGSTSAQVIVYNMPILQTATTDITSITKATTPKYVNDLIKLSGITPKVFYVSTTGSDANDGKSVYTAKLTLSSAAAAAGNTGNQVVVLPGTYNETTTITNLNLSITAANTEIRGIVNFTGTITVNNASSSLSITGLTINTLIHSGAGSLYLFNTNTNTAFSSTGSGYLQCENCSFAGVGNAGTTSITGTGSKVFTNACMLGVLTVNNASAIVSITQGLQLYNTTLTAGILSIGTTTVYNVTGNNATPSIAISAGSTLYLTNSACFNVDGTYSIINVPSGALYSLNNSNIAANSTLSGTNLGRIAYFDGINFRGTTAGSVPYQTSSGTTAFTAAGTTGQVLTSNGVGAPTWTTKSIIGDVKSGLQIADHNGWLLWTNGRSLSRTTYADLWSFVQTNSLVATGLFGVGDGSTTFTLGDINGRSIGITGTGSGLTTRTLGGKVGAETHVLTTNEMPSHTHDAAMKWSGDNSHNHSNNNGIFSEATTGTGGGEYLKGLTSTGSNVAHNNMQPSVFLNFFVYAG